jgi:NAD(P)-dependent dehydrogenase (short-subunit alcohol dehydrogenase family)
MITKGGLNIVARSLAIEHAKEGIRFNDVARGNVDMPMPKDDSKDGSQEISANGKDREHRGYC